MERAEMVKMLRRNRVRGAVFEGKVRRLLEKDEWNVVKFINTVDFESNKMRRAKSFKGLMRNMGFPDFLCFKQALAVDPKLYYIIGVEAKSQGYLSQEEKKMCRWYLDNRVFHQILIAYKGKSRGEVLYKEFKYLDN